MKKILIVLLSICLIIGCSKKEELSLNIPKWMTTGNMSKNEYIQILGVGYEEFNSRGHFAYIWDGYELIKGYKGTLRLQSSSNYIAWFWTLSANEKDYNKICDIVKASLGDPISYNEYEKKKVYNFNFKPVQKDQPLGIVYENEVLTIGWGYEIYPEEDET